MYILDSDTLTHLHAGNPRVVENLRNTADPDMVTTIVTKIETLISLVLYEANELESK